jgi:RNA polymerase sigma-70 factor (ECF subfamily)
MSQPEEALAGLLERLRDMDARAWSRIMSQYRDGIVFYCMRKVGNREDAEDIASQAFLRAVGAIGSFRGESSIKTWLHRIAENLCLTHRARGRRDHIDLDDIPRRDIERGALNSPELPADRVIAGNEVRSALDRALDTLDPQLREAFHLGVVAEMSYDDIARITGAPLNTVKTRIFRARERLRQLLVEHRQ